MLVFLQRVVLFLLLKKVILHVICIVWVYVINGYLVFAITVNMRHGNVQE